MPTERPGPIKSARQIVAFANDDGGEVVVDVDADDRVIGIEVLGATAVLRPETIRQLRRL